MRSRNIKPALFKNEILGVIDPIYTVLFAGLWCLADREGRLEDRPLRIKAEIFPYRDLPDINGYLTELERLEFICRYTVGNGHYIQVINFQKHQNPHKTEKASIIPENTTASDSCALTVKQPLNNGEITEDALLIPDSLLLIPDSKDCATPASQPDNNHAKKSNRGTRLPHDWTLPETCRQWAIKNFPSMNIDDQENRFRDHWIAQPGQKGVKTDWPATWRNWCRNSRDMNPKSKTQNHDIYSEA